MSRRRPSRRRLSRQCAAQAMYAVAAGGQTAQDALAGLDQFEPSVVKVDDFARALCQETYKNLERIDRELADVIEHWRPERLSMIDRAVLRLATSEILFFPDIPPRVTMDEYIELAKVMGGDQSPPFINGVIDRVLARNPKKII